MTRIESWNVNGIRACVNKGHFFDYLEKYSPDIVGLQETKALPENLMEDILNPSGYHTIWNSAERKGYSGVALFTKEKPIRVLSELGIDKFDCEGRMIMAEYKNFIVFTVYFPNGQKNEERLQYKLDFYTSFFELCDELSASGKQLIIMGDYNTAHHEIDLARPKENEGNSGFLPIERAWMDELVNRGYVDSFRHFDKTPNHYTWWTYRSAARKRNIGWRIDYIFVTPNLIPSTTSAYIRNDVLGSDHCPVGIELDL